MCTWGARQAMQHAKIISCRADVWHQINTKYSLLPEFHVDLFSRHARPLEFYVFVAVNERGGRCYVRRDLSSMQRKTTKKEAWQPKCAAPRLGYEQNQKATYCCFYLGYQNEVTFIGGISERRPKSEPFVFVRLFRIRGPKSTWEGGREGGR